MARSKGRRNKAKGLFMPGRSSRIVDHCKMVGSWCHGLCGDQGATMLVGEVESTTEAKAVPTCDKPDAVTMETADDTLCNMRGFLTREDIRAVEDQAFSLHGMLNHYAQISRQIEKRRKSIDEEIKHIVEKYTELEQRNKRTWKKLNAMNPDAKIKHAASDQLRRKREQVAELEKENEDLERKDNDISDKLSTICIEHGRLHDVVRVARQLLLGHTGRK